MFKIESLKEVIFLLLTILLLAGVIFLFVYIIRSEDGEMDMIEFLSSLRSETQTEQVEKDLDKSLLEEEKFLELEENPAPHQGFDSGTRNPF